MKLRSGQSGLDSVLCMHVATQPNAVLTVSSATCEDVLGVLSHLMRLLSQPFGSEPVSNLCGQQQWLKSVEVDV